MFGLDHHVKAVEQGRDQGMGAGVLVVGGGEQAVLVVEQELVQVFPVAAVNAVENQALFGLGQAVDFVNDLDRQLGEVAPHHMLFALVELAQIGSADDFLFGLFGVAGDLAAPDDAERNAVQQRGYIFGRGGLAQTRLTDDQGFAAQQRGQQTEQQGRVQLFSAEVQVGAVQVQVFADEVVHIADDMSALLAGLSHAFTPSSSRGTPPVVALCAQRSADYPAKRMGVSTKRTRRRV